MADKVRVAVDAMGGDNAPKEVIKGAVEAVNAKEEIQLILVGVEDKIKQELANYTYPKERIRSLSERKKIPQSWLP